MRLKRYFLVVFIGTLSSTGALAGTVNINVTDLDELAKNIHGIGSRLV